MNGFEASFSLTADAIRWMREPNGYGITTWFLALVFAWSGIAKLRQPALAAMAMVDFGVIRRVRPRLGFALGAAELLLALSLAIRLFPRLSLSIAALLLWLFVLLIARSLWSGERFACFCFGDLDSQLSGLTLARTTILALLASLSSLITVPPYIPRVLSQADALQAVVALSLLGTIMLLSRIPDLPRWNHDPTGTRTTMHSGGRVK